MLMDQRRRPAGPRPAAAYLPGRQYGNPRHAMPAAASSDTRLLAGSATDQTDVEPRRPRHDDKTIIRAPPTVVAATDSLMLSVSATNNHSLLSFGHNGGASVDDGDGDIDADIDAEQAMPTFLLPHSANFDDLHASLDTASSEFQLTQFPPPPGEDMARQARAVAADAPPAERPSVAVPPAATTTTAATATTITSTTTTTHTAPLPTRATNPPPVSRPARSGSILRRPSLSKQPAAPSTASTASTAGLTPRLRRQNHNYPPVSSANFAKPPRRSLEPATGVAGAADADARAPRRHQSLLDALTGNRHSAATVGGSAIRPVTDDAVGAAGRASKAKSVVVQPPPAHRPRDPGTAAISQGSDPPQGPPLASHLAAPPRSPGLAPNKRASGFYGLGARTKSPTDTVRAKRMSIAPQSFSCHQLLGGGVLLPRPSPGPSVHDESRSPSTSMIPRKSATPSSSSRTTPDPSAAARKPSSNLGPSAVAGTTTSTIPTSATTMNTTTTMTRNSSSTTPRAVPAQSASTSRLQAPKSMTNLLPPIPATTGDDEEDVPPVPAIPTNYQSPKPSPAEYERRRALGLDTSSLASNSTGTGSVVVVTTAEPKLRRRPSARKSAYVPTTSKETRSRRNLQPLKLPPINLAPLNAATTAKIDELRRQGANRDVTPPPQRPNKTPTTPMTASRSTFFSRHRDDGELRHPRSSSSIHQPRFETPSVIDGGATTSSETISMAMSSTDLARKSSFSPNLSSSSPKTSTETPPAPAAAAVSSSVKRVPTNDGTMSPIGLGLQEPHMAQTVKLVTQEPARTVRPVVKSPPNPPSGPEQPPTPSSMSSLRRKLSLSWKRNTSKSNITTPPQPQTGATSLAEPSAAPRYEAVPPPRKPLPPTAQQTQAKLTITTTAATTSSSKPSSPATATKKPYLESRRRKSSASSLTAALSNAVHKSESWSAGDSAKKESIAETSTERSNGTNGANGANGVRSASVMQKLLRAKASTATIKSSEVYTAEVDKDDVLADDEMRRLGSRRKETEIAGRTLDALRKRATPKERVDCQEARRIAMLNFYERGEIVDFPDVYFCGTQHAKKVIGSPKLALPNFGYDDERGDYTIVVGDHLAYRYEVVDVLGKGSFGQVVRCIDHRTGGLVAVKIIRNKKRFHQQALVEVSILKKIREWDPHNRHSMVNFGDSFYFRGHLCISTELLDMNLYEFIKAHNFRGFSLRIIRRFTKQMLSSLCLLKQEKVIHCDLKPENILLRHPLHSEIKVIDFGSSCFENEKVYTYIQSRFYRSPEVILGMTYGLPIDMWSLGCILAELYTGVPIFPGENEQEQLACIMEIFGPPEKHLIEKSTRRKLFFDSMGKPRLTVSSKGRRRRPSSKTLQQSLKCDDEPFLDFLARCLRWDPDRRLTPDQAIRHEFITGQKMQVAPRTSIREGSPARRSTTVVAPRPLPDPPGASKPSGFARVRDPAGISPHKPTVASTARRTSGNTNGTATTTGATTFTGHVKRLSMGPATLASASSLPRPGGGVAGAGGRSVSSNLASAGAAAAMSRRN